MKQIISTLDCYEAFHIEEQSWIIGDSFTKEAGFDMTTVQWSQSAWEDEKNYFSELLNGAISAHEKRYGTDIVHIALAGKVGLWNRTPIGGRLLKADANPIDYIGQVDAISVVQEDDGVITINGHHHDGTHRMRVYLLSENMLNKINPNWDNDYSGLGADDFKTIYETRKPLKLKAV